MRNLFILLLLVVLLSTFVASECVPGNPLIGTLGDIKEEYRTSVEYGFDKVAIIGQRTEEIVSIDYEDVVLDYVSGKILIDEAINKKKENKKIFVATPAINFFKKGNIVVIGSPIQSCSYSFKGVFDSSGKLKTGVFGSYGIYKYGGTLINVSPGDSVKCEGLNCNVEVNFDINGEKVTLRPGDNYISKGHSVNTVTLIDANDFGFEENNNGAGTYAVFLIDFQDKVEGDYVPKSDTKIEEDVNSKSSVKIEERVKWDSEDNGVVIIENSQDENTEKVENEKLSTFDLVIRWLQWFSFFFPENK